MATRYEVDGMYEPGMTSPYVGVGFLAGLSFSPLGLITSILGAVLVGLLGKVADSLIRGYFQNRSNRWRQEAIKWRRKYREREFGDKE